MTRVAIRALGGARLDLEGYGHGPAVLALHGFTGNSEMWRPLEKALEQGYTTIGVDVIGHGASDVPEDPDWYTMERFVAALEEVLDKLSLKRACWLGYSMGGRIALNAAVALPHRTSGLVLESASPGLASEGERLARIESDRRLADWIESVGVQSFVDYWESLPLWASQGRLSPCARGALRQQRLSCSARGLANSLRGMGTGAQLPLHHHLREIGAPTLIMAGEEDAKFLSIAEGMHTAIPHSCLARVPEAGHAVHLEQPERYTSLVLQFLSTTVASGHSRSPGSL